VAAITIERVSRVFPGGVRALNDVSLEIADGEFMVLVGPSGCGKSTLLRSLAGLEEIDGGRIWLGGTDITDLGPQERDMAMVFQNYALYPHKTVAQNLEFGLKMRKVPPAERATRVGDAARILGLDTLLDRKPNALSGGQRQRVAMGRAIVRQPQAFLMDEPLSNLDAKLRVTMRAELTKLHQRFGVTTVYVTHDQVEAMTLGTRVAVMRDGVIQQCDSPKVLFDHPVNLFVAAFIGSPSMNLVGGVIDGGHFHAGSWRLPLPDERWHGERREVIAGIRPTDFEVADSAPAAWPRVEVTALTVEELGSESMVLFHLDAPAVTADALTPIHADQDTDQVGLFADEDRAQFTARIDGRTSVRPGDRLTLAIDTSRLHAFDPVSGAALANEFAGATAATG
jgi:multiple sugar transport system ATP-binding protein